MTDWFRDALDLFHDGRKEARDILSKPVFYAGSVNHRLCIYCFIKTKEK